MTLIAWTEFGPQLGSFTIQLIVIVTSFAVVQIFVHNFWSFLGAVLSRTLPNSIILSRSLILLTIILCLLLGMGLPTTANYVVVASLMATVLVDVGNASGFIFPLIAVHLFVFILD